MTADEPTDNVVIVSENRGLYSRHVNYVARRSVKDENIGYLVEDICSQSSSLINWFLEIKLTLRQVFLPHGYPNSVSKDYLAYQVYDTIQAFCSSLTGALATEAVMKGVGVGDDTATPLAAALTWLLKSGSGMVGQILFAWSKGTSLDGDCKKWRFFADVVNDMATCIDLLTPAIVHPQLRVGVFCISSVARSLVGVAGGATRAAITQHQAKANNSADVSAKDGSQETLVNLIALIASLVILPLVSGNHILVWSFYFLFTFLHLLANYKAIKSLQFDSLNNARLFYCLNRFNKFGTVPSVKMVNLYESVFVGMGIKDTKVTCNGYKIRLGSSIKKALIPGQNTLNTQAYSLEQMRQLISESEGKNFLIIPNVSDKTIHVILHESVTPWETVEACARAFFLTYHLESNQLSNDRFRNFQLSSGMDKLCTNSWRSFQAGLTQQGYARDRASLEMNEWRCSWQKHFFPSKKLN